MTTVLYITFVLALSVVVITSIEHPRDEGLTVDIKVKYFSNVNMECDHHDLNITTRDDVLSLAWIFPDGSLVRSSAFLNPLQYRLQGVPDTIKTQSPRDNYDGYNLTALEVKDEVFGYYTCVVSVSNQHQRLSNQHQRLLTIRYGLNVDGADFSELLDEYRSNAIVGGIAAAVLLALIVICWVIWYKFCYEKVTENEEEGEVGRQIEMKEGCPGDRKDNSYNNDAFTNENEKKDSGNNMNESNGSDQVDTNSRL